jgi:hypothetical protein
LLEGLIGASSGTFSLGDTAHVIQVSLAPAFLLTALATLLNVFSTRLARVADQVDGLAARIEDADRDEAARLSRRLSHLRLRSLVLDAAVVLAAVGGALVGVSILTLFLGALRDAATASVLFLCFGLAVACTIAALGAFLAEILIASRVIRIVVADKQVEAADKG